ncbi:MAG: NAD(P)/FAD-dependent oxidoreductase [Candidatus Yanofskybacteria bacterium]|nr:NAD(P)/FAD-dependent oxidoreductase [Candidatus Yanofskybacteria bacterium]
MPDVRRTIVILGAGFGGIYAYLRLRARIDRTTTRIVIVNATNHFLFSPLLHEAATGSLGLHNVVQGVREIIDGDCADLVQATVESIDISGHVVRTDRGPIGYDHLVIATGAHTDTMRVPGITEHALFLKDLHDAQRLRERFIEQFECAGAAGASGVVQGALRFVVVGGGPTGVELAAEMSDLLSTTFLRLYRRRIAPGDAEIVLVHAGERLLPQFDEHLSRAALATLRRKGVRVLLNTRVARVQVDGVHVGGGSFLDAHTVIWVAGVCPRVPLAFPALPLHESGRIAVDEFLRVRGTDSVWALGDVAAAFDQNGTLLPMRAQVAVCEAEYCADNVVAAIAKRPLSAMQYESRGDLVSLGRWSAVGRIAGIRWSGPSAWWLWRTVYLFNFASWGKRLRIAVDWTVGLFAPRDITSV